MGKLFPITLRPSKKLHPVDTQRKTVHNVETNYLEANCFVDVVAKKTIKEKSVMQKLNFIASKGGYNHGS